MVIMKEEATASLHCWHLNLRDEFSWKTHLTSVSSSLNSTRIHTQVILSERTTGDKDSYDDFFYLL